MQWSEKRGEIRLRLGESTIAEIRRIFNACGGGTGSGLGCLLLERLSVDYGKKSKISFTVWSCPQISSACVEPYNTVLCVHSLLEHTDVTNQVNNAWRIPESNKKA